jgi:hypothetical protein
LLQAAAAVSPSALQFSVKFQLKLLLLLLQVFVTAAA